MQNSGNKNTQELYDNYEDALFRLAMHEVAEIEGKRLFEEAKQMEDDPAFMPSKEAEEKFMKLLDTELKKKKKESRGRRPYLKKAITVIAAVIVLLSIGLLTVDAFRIQVFNFVLGINDKYTSFQLQDNGGEQNSSHMIVDWQNAYMPTYIPDGYVVGNFVNSTDSKSILFKNNQDDNIDIVYSEYATSTNLELDSENASVLKTIDINGNKGTLFVKNKMVTVAWVMDNRMFTVNGQVDKNLIIKIAESVKYVK